MALIQSLRQQVNFTATEAAIRYVLNCLYGVIYATDLQKNSDYKNRIDGVGF